MGNTQKSSHIDYQHPKLRQCSKENNDLVLTPPSNMIVNDWIRRVRDFEKKIHPEHRLLIPKIQQAVGGKFCGTEVAYKLLYPNFQFNLKKEISDRRPTKQQFTEPQLWYLLYQLLFSSYQFQKNKMKSGDVRPANILLNADGQMLLINTFSFPDQTTNYRKTLEFHETTYLAPEQLWQIEQKIQYPKSDPPTGQSFSIGMTIIDAALLINSQELYDFKKIRFDNNSFNNNVVKFKTDKYSPFFVKTVLNLVEAKSVERITPGEAWAIIRPYTQSILNLEEFTPDREESKKSLTFFQHNQ